MPLFRHQREKINLKGVSFPIFFSMFSSWN
jgi:hypothetical protein